METKRPPVKHRLAVAFVFAVVAGVLTWWKMTQEPGGIAADYTWYWRAARALIDGHSPYAVIKANGPYPFDAGFYYPMTSAMIITPIAMLAPAIGSGILMAVGTFLLAFGITRDGYSRLPIFGSVPFFVCLESVQFAPLIAAAALIPGVGWLSTVKPNIGIAALAYNPTILAFASSAAFVVLSVILFPSWPGDWLQSIRERASGNYGSPLLLPGGFLLLLSALRWKRPEGRLLLVMSIVPQSLLFTDQLMLWLIPRSRNESMILSILSLPAMFLGVMNVGPNPNVATWAENMAPAILWLLYIPCLIMVLRNKDGGTHPSRISTTLTL